MSDLPFASVPAVPDAIAYYEFLLDENRLKVHLESPDSEPSASELIWKFFEQANKPINDQGQILPPPENQKNLTLKSLALQCGAYLKWDLDVLEKELPMSCRHQLLREMLAFCNAPSFPSRTLDIKTQIASMHDHTVMAIVLYCRWAAKTVVSSAFLSKPGGRATPNAPAPGLYQVANDSPLQRYEEMKEKIIAIVKDQCFDVVQTLETFLQQINRTVYAPDLDCIKDKQLCNPDEKKGWLVPFQELHAQVCYDLGCLHFMHGFYDKAYEMFKHVREWLNCLPEKTTGYCKIDQDTLTGYLTACASLNLQPVEEKMETPDDISDSTFTLVMKCLKRKDETAISELGELFLADLEKDELPMSFRDQAEQDLLHQSTDSSTLKTYFDVIWSNAVCRAIRGYTQPCCLWTYHLNISQLQKILGFVQHAYNAVSRKGRKKLGGFLYSLHNNLSSQQLRKELTQCPITNLCVAEAEMTSMLQRETTSHEAIVQDSPMSPDGAESEDTDVFELESRAVTSFEPDTLKHIITQLHKLSPETQHWRICDRWTLNPDYESVLKTISVAISRDLMYILLAKAKQYANDTDLLHTSRKLLTYVQDHGKALSFKLQKIAKNELLRLEIFELLNDSTLKFSSEKECKDLREQLSETLNRARQHLTKAPNDVVTSPSDLSDFCVALLINLEDYSFFDSLSSQASTGSLKFMRVLAKVHMKISTSSPPHSEAKRSSKELWSIVADIFAATIYQQRRSQDNSIVILKKTDVPTPVLSRPGFVSLVKKIKNPAVLKILTSMLVRLHRLCQEDILTEIKVPLAELWPSSLSGSQAGVSTPCLADSLRAILQYCLTVQPHNVDCLRTHADFDFAYCNYPSAFRNYLKLIAVQSNFFNMDILHSGILNTQVVRRMVKCCMQMKCSTQAAALCQMTKDVDYSTAFKALQESRDRSDAMETHYREHFWDVELLEYATFMHRDSGETAKKESALRALANPEINVCNTPKVLRQVQTAKSLRFFRALARQFLVS